VTGTVPETIHSTREKKMLDQVTAIATCILGGTSIAGLFIALYSLSKQRKDANDSASMQLASLIINFQAQRKMLFWKTGGSSTLLDTLWKQSANTLTDLIDNKTADNEIRKFLKLLVKPEEKTKE